MDKFRIAFVSGKLGAVDGVSLEVDKWIEILQKMGHEIFTIAGNYAHPLESIPIDNQFSIPEISFDSEFQKKMEQRIFPFIRADTITPPVTAAESRVHERRIWLEGIQVANKMKHFIYQKNIDLLIAENTNAMPMTLLGAVAVYIMAVKNDIATIFHHHDFWWERSRFFNSRIEGLLDQIMPPRKQGIEHVVISSYAEHVLRVMKRTDSVVVPNCENFHTPPCKDEYNSSFRSDLGFKEDDILAIQPTRIVPRKRIEDSLNFLGKFIARYPEYQERVHFIISLYQGDEQDDGYVERIQEQAKRLNIPLHLIADRVAAVRGKDEQGRKLYTNRDALVNADIALYLPVWEGFGNALLEIYAAKVLPIVSTYLVYKTDIKKIDPRGIEIQDEYDENGFLKIENSSLDDLHHILKSPLTVNEIVHHNFRCAAKSFSLDALQEILENLINDYGVEVQASRRRMLKNSYRFSV